MNKSQSLASRFSQFNGEEREREMKSGNYEQYHAVWELYEGTMAL